MAAKRSGSGVSSMGLVLSGGGARAAYQVGVLKALGDMLPRGARNPFPIICGTSAGAINATAIATHAQRFRAATRGLEAVWSEFHADHIYRTEFSTLATSALRWLTALFFGGLGVRRPASLLDSEPLRELLARLVRFDRIRAALAAGDLAAVSVTASAYHSGESVAFFEGAPHLQGWRRARRVGVPTRLGLDHLMASSAIPGIFPAVRLEDEYFGDGSVRQLAPISPALHLGADRVMVIGVGGTFRAPPWQAEELKSPSIAEIAGHLLDSAFLDSLEGDIERLKRINRTISLIPEKVRQREGLELRPIDVLTISPSQPLGIIATEQAYELPRSMRFFLRGAGATSDPSGSAVMSYLLFEQGYCRRLIRLGYSDALKREPEILRFLGYDPVALHGGKAAFPPQDVW
ncbi:MAG TPA: patatin-like phospholipase family protein [Gammaproteobacteria bacterium]|nr:patatin-like phospholipase family protein [Gammaproteobacteria bacterium]